MLRGEIIYIDGFGNAITNLREPSAAATMVRVKSSGECAVKRYYAEVAPGQPLALIGSGGYLEIAVNGGSAAQVLGLQIGDAVEVR